MPAQGQEEANRRASDANYDPVQMDMSEVQWKHTAVIFRFLVIKYETIVPKKIPQWLYGYCMYMQSLRRDIIRGLVSGFARLCQIISQCYL